MPKSNTEYWNEKLIKNVQRDEKNNKELSEMGWNILIVWECELKKDKRENTLEYLYYNIIRNIKD